MSAAGKDNNGAVSYEIFCHTFFRRLGVPDEVLRH
eukprot:CAMPEP_0194479812 /NCGR_PEP_ID=MMETSP0253-20130528/2824_1 /TAXON_ID=2966 /ORGANISM="Noctiluca scintillans" /LENGTH=34 /DNA_ID= /DNA_START= /DNA_END= /DNA_ORIENTATION=